MRRKLLGVALVTMMSGLLLSGCKQNVGTPEDNAVVEEESDVEEEEDTEEDETMEEGEILIGYSCIDLENPYYVTLQKSIEYELKDTDMRLMARGAQSDAQLQNEQIQEMIDAGVEAVFLCPADREEITPALEALSEAGIPVINLDTQVKEVRLTDAYIGSDNKSAGTLCGNDLIARYPDGGSILIFECPAMNSVNERITGFEEAVKGGGFEVLARADANGEKDKAYEMMKEYLEEYPQIDAVMCGNDRMALGVFEAVRESGRTDVRIYGVDGSPEMKKELAAGTEVIAGTAAQSPINIGKKAVEILLALQNGDKYEEESIVETFFIDRDNVELYGTNGWQ